eukprot:CAMPEP_0177745772 /NCGR_PEP_ID=MMETSP0484_2-20121128/30498_1 /TAXON_ID=354590 /ORGANISM="Rhodomonas lens, Strain RHODO" /LENGTH=71 /DNA_ID=CAMNT_0019260445 /DNA_START=190 /DNA_END=403 /DNA_ORIENTATION=+
MARFPALRVPSEALETSAESGRAAQIGDGVTEHRASELDDAVQQAASAACKIRGRGRDREGVSGNGCSAAA